MQEGRKTLLISALNHLLATEHSSLHFFPSLIYSINLKMLTQLVLTYSPQRQDGATFACRACHCFAKFYQLTSRLSES